MFSRQRLRCGIRRKVPLNPERSSKNGNKAATTTKLTPLHDRIVVSRIAEAETSRGGIIIPDTAKDKPQEGEVIAVGKGKSNDEGKVFPLVVKAGDPSCSVSMPAPRSRSMAKNY